MPTKTLDQLIAVGEHDLIQNATSFKCRRCYGCVARKSRGARQFIMSPCRGQLDNKAKPQKYNMQIMLKSEFASKPKAN